MQPELLLLYIYSYLAGAFPTANVLSKWLKGVDLRHQGSGNVGGSNLMRQMGKKWAIPLVAIEFALKGLSPLLLAYLLLDSQTPSFRESFPLYLVPILVLVGNNWSVFLRFQGGRGLMVVCAVMFVLAPPIFLVAFSMYLFGWWASRSSAVWALVAMVSLPVLALTPGEALVVDWPALWRWITGGALVTPDSGVARATSLLCLVMLALVVLKRITANSLSFPEGMSRREVLFNRIVRDRDVASRESWVSRDRE